MKIVTFGEVMMRLQAPNYERFSQAQSFNITFGGGEANVASSLAILGLNVAHVTQFPTNDLGVYAKNFFKNIGVDTSFIQFGGNRLGLYFVENGAGLRSSKIIYDRENSSFGTIKKDQFNWEIIFENATWFHFTGITPAISKAAFETCMQAVKLAKKMGLTVSADLGYRANLWQWGKKPANVMPQLVQYCDHIVCSAYDVKDMLGAENGTFKDIAPQIFKNFPNLNSIITTNRGQLSATHNTLQGAAFVNNIFFETKIIDIPHIVDRIGGGDAFMAGYIYGIGQKFDTQKTLDFAVAASAIKHTIEGDINLANLAEITELMEGNTGGKIKR